MLIESKIEIRHDSMFNIPQANFKSAHLLNKMALVQSQSGRTVCTSSVSCMNYAQAPIATTLVSHTVFVYSTLTQNTLGDSE